MVTIQAALIGRVGRVVTTSLEKKKRRSKTWKELDQILIVDDDGELTEGKDAQGNHNPRHFLIGGTRFQWMRDQVVLSQSPYVPFNDDDDR